MATPLLAAWIVSGSDGQVGKLGGDARVDATTGDAHTPYSQGMSTRVMVIGRQGGKPPFGLPESRTGAEYVMAKSMVDVRDHLADCDVVFHYGRPRDALSANWALTGRLRWLHVGGVGVDWTLFPELVESDVVLTNSRGVFDTTLPEYLLALMLALAKDVPGTIRAQEQRQWQHRMLEPLAAVAWSSSAPARSLVPPRGCCVPWACR